jgi:hypothetical protein
MTATNIIYNDKGKPFDSINNLQHVPIEVLFRDHQLSCHDNSGKQGISEMMEKITMVTNSVTPDNSFKVPNTISI